mgnify:CR=1 FL=1
MANSGKCRTHSQRPGKSGTAAEEAASVQESAIAAGNSSGTGQTKSSNWAGLVAPQGYQNQLQFLLPICLTDMEKPNLAMTLAERNGYYLGSTCLTPEMAYLNARMIARPIAPWLTSLVKK